MVNLVGDIGGTNTRLALADGHDLRVATVSKFRNADYPSLEAVIAAYIAAQGNPDCASACVAVAGPVQDGVGRLTNLDWQIDRATLAKASRAERAEVINDLQAQGYALGHHRVGTLENVVAGTSDPEGTQLVIGVGTGMNIALALPTGAGRLVPPAEAGHVSLPLRDAEDWQFAKWLDARVGFASVEEALSGRGLENIHECRTGVRLSTRDIIAGAAAGEAAALASVAQFVRLLASVAGNLALTMLPTGGIFLIGGMCLATQPWFARAGFEAAFRDKGRFSDFLAQFPVHVVTDDFAALTGAASFLA